MASDSEYIETISHFNWKDIENLWTGIKERNTPGWEDGRAFEYLVLQSFRLEGAEIRWPYRVRLMGAEIEQIDGIVYTDGLACLLECKDYSRNVSFEPIAKVRNQLMRRPSVTIGSVFSTLEYKEPAVILANFIHPQTILALERKGNQILHPTKTVLQISDPEIP